MVGRYTAGMPQLCGSGLSENWLLKECGHRHWLAIAHRQGLARPRFHDALGQQVYAAFTLVRIQAKSESPLLALIGGGGAMAISTLAEITFYGTDQAGREVVATANISVNFADGGDPE